MSSKDLLIPSSMPFSVTFQCKMLLIKIAKQVALGQALKGMVIVWTNCSGWNLCLCSWGAITTGIAVLPYTASNCQDLRHDLSQRCTLGSTGSQSLGEGARARFTGLSQITVGGQFPARSTGRGAQTQPGNLTVLKKQKQELRDIEVAGICETEYERRDSCVETARELQNLSS